MSNIKTFNFEGQLIEFDLNEKNIMVNATEMAKVFDKRIDHFLRSEHAENFINAMLEFPPYGGNSEPLKREEILQTRGKSGTWMHRILALKFAAWLNPKFELWVYATIDDLLFGKYKEIDTSLRKTAEIKTRIEDLETELLNTEQYKEIERLRLAEKQEAYQRRCITKQQISLFKES